MEREWENEIKNEGSQIKALFSYFLFLKIALLSCNLCTTKFAHLSV